MCYVLQQTVDSAELSCSVRALQQDLEKLKSVNISLRKENHSLREQLNTARNGNEEVTPRLLLKRDDVFMSTHILSILSVCQVGRVRVVAQYGQAAMQSSLDLSRFSTTA